MCKNTIFIFTIFSILGNIYLKIEENEYKRIYNIGKDFNEIAVVVSEGKETEYKITYVVKIQGSSDRKNKKFIIRLDKKSKVKIKYGDLIKIRGEYIFPNSARNYKGFDYSNYLKSQKIYGTVNVKSIELIKNNSIDLVLNIINKLRNAIIDNSEKLIANKDASGILIGILIGNTNYAEDEVIENFKNSSLAHMLAVSGQHVSYIVLAIGCALKLCKIGKKTGKFITIFILIVFMILTGLTPSIFRAGIMGILIIVASLMYRKSDIYTNMFLSLFIILIVNPFAVFDIGVWLSYRRSIRNCFIL